MADELKVIPFYGLGGMQSRGEAVNAAIEQNFQQLCDAINELSGANKAPVKKGGK